MTGTRHKVWFGLLILLIAAMCPFEALHAQTQKIRISLSSRSNTNTSYYTAQAKGFFRDEGLEVEFIQVNPRLGAMAVLNGDVTFTTSFVSTFCGIVQGLPMKAVFILLKKGIYFLRARRFIRHAITLSSVSLSYPKNIFKKGSSLYLPFSIFGKLIACLI